MSQQHEFQKIVSHSKNVLSWLRKTNQKGHIAPALSRTGIAYAVLGERDKSKACFEKAMDIAINDHQAITISVFWSLAQRFRGVSYPNNDPNKTVIDAQTRYLQVNADNNIAQAYPYKSTVQCMFAEATMLMDGLDSNKGWGRLIITYLLRHKAWAHSSSEGYAELIAMVENENIKKQIVSAMLPTITDVFLQYPEVTQNLGKCQEVLKGLDNENTIQYWATLRKSVENIL